MLVIKVCKELEQAKHYILYIPSGQPDEIWTIHLFRWGSSIT